MKNEADLGDSEYEDVTDSDSDEEEEEEEQSPQQ